MSADVFPAADAAHTNNPDGSGALTVWVGAPLTLTALPAQGQLLLVEADQERVHQLKEALRSRGDVMVCAEVLTAETGTPVPWFRFNDQRLNGPQSESHWRPYYPNLRQLGLEQRSGRRLDDVLEAWSAQQGGRPPIELRLYQGDPLAALEGLGAWLALVQVVQWPERLGPVGSLEELAMWLSGRGFRAVDNAATTWRRDPVASQRLALRERERQIATLQEQLATLTVQLELAESRHEELSRAHAQLEDDFKGLRLECDTMTADRDALLMTCQELTSQRDQGHAERNQLSAERDAYHDRALNLQQRLDHMKTELNAVLLLLDRHDFAEDAPRLA